MAKKTKTASIGKVFSSRRLKFPFEFSLKREEMSPEDLCVPDQALSIPELIERYSREQKPLPKKRDYDMDAVLEEYDSITIPFNVSREDALHLLDKTKAHIHKLEYAMRRSSEVPSEEVDASPKEQDAPAE